MTDLTNEDAQRAYLELIALARCCRENGVDQEQANLIMSGMEPPFFRHISGAGILLGKLARRLGSQDEVLDDLVREILDSPGVDEG